MGLNDDGEIMTNLLSKQIIKASKNTLLENHANPRIWLVNWLRRYSNVYS